MSNLARRKFVNSTMTVVTGLCALFAVASLFFILGYIFWGGVRGLSLGFLVNSPKPIGEPDSGIANAIVGSVILISLGSLVGMPVGIMGGIYLSEFGSNKFGLLLRFLIDTLTGTPSIIVGVFVWTVMVHPMGHFSALSGGVALGIMMMPIVARTTEEMIRLVPQNLREAQVACDARRSVAHRCKRGRYRSNAGNCEDSRRNRAVAVYGARAELLKHQPASADCFVDFSDLLLRRFAL